MSRFTEILTVSPLPNGTSWVLRKPFGYDVGHEDSGETIEIPAGFTTDFASIPRFLWGMLPCWGKYGNAAVIHDYCYWEQKYPRRRADEIFREAMGVLRVSRIKIRILYWMVRLFGWIHWRKRRKDKQNGVQPFLDPIPRKVSDWKSA